MHRPGIEPGPPAWQASILPLNQRCFNVKQAGKVNFFFYMPVQILFATLLTCILHCSQLRFFFYAGCMFILNNIFRYFYLGKMWHFYTLSKSFSLEFLRHFLLISLFLFIAFKNKALDPGTHPQSSNTSKQYIYIDAVRF